MALGHLLTRSGLTHPEVFSMVYRDSFCQLESSVSLPYKKSWTNRELEEMSKRENIVKWIKGQKISWIGHLERMEEDRMPKKIFTQELEGTRRRVDPGKDGKRK